MQGSLNNILHKRAMDLYELSSHPGGMSANPWRDRSCAPRTTALFLLLGSVFCVQFGQAFGKQLFGAVGPWGVVALRLGLAAVVLSLVHRPAMPRTWADARLVLGFGTAIASMNLLYPSLRHLPLGLAGTLQMLGPVSLALLSSRGVRDLAPAALAGCGVWFFNGPSSEGFPLAGMLLALASGASMACYFLLSRRAGGRAAGGAPLAAAVAWAAVLTVPVGVWESGPALLEPRTLAFGLGVAVLSAVLPYSFELAALRRLPARAVAVLASLEPATAGLAGTVVLAEHLRPEQWVAFGCVGAASAWTVARRNPDGAPPRDGRAAAPSGGERATCGDEPRRTAGSAPREN